MIKKPFVIIFLVIIGLVIFALGGGAGSFYKTQQVVRQLEKTSEIIKALNSKLIPSITAYGNVKSISGNNIILTRSGEDLTIQISNDAKVFVFVIDPKTRLGASKDARLSDIKVGDTITANIYVDEDGLIKGNGITITPSANNANIAE